MLHTLIPGPLSMPPPRRRDFDRRDVNPPPRATADVVRVPADDRLEGVDLFRCLGALAVLLIHATPQLPWIAGEPCGGVMSRCLVVVSAFAVPFFFATAGYFAGASRRKSGESGFALFGPRAGRVAMLVAVWAAIYVLVPYDWNRSFRETSIVNVVSNNADGWFARLAADPMLLVIMSGTPHLWFLSALLQAYLLMGILTAPALRLSPRTMGALAAILYVASILSTAYATTPIGLNVPVRHLQYSVMYALLPVVAGYLLGTGDWQRPRRNVAIALLFGGVIGSVVEYALLNRFSALRGSTIHLLATAPAGVGALAVALSMPKLPGKVARLPVRRFCSAAAPLTLGVYLIHPLLIGPVDGLLRRAGTPAEDAGFVVTFFAALLVVKVMRSIPGARVLVR